MKHLMNLRRRENLFSLIEESRKQKESLELIVGAKDGRHHEMARRIRPLGKVGRVYEYIPFFSLRMAPEEAYLMASYVHRDFVRQNACTSFERSYRDLLENLSSVDASSRFRCSPHARGVVHRSLDVDGLWNLESVGAYDAQDISTGEGVKIAIIDTGIDYNHPELRARFGSDKGYDFVRDSTDPMDQEGHGSHVAGTACSANCGVSLDSKLYSVRVLDEYGSGSEADIIAGIEYCIKREMDVANMSLGCEWASSAFEAICQKAYDDGLVLVAAAGNEGYGADYPAAFGESVIAVAAIDSENQHADFSNVWKTNDISAPGVGIMSCLLGGGYTTMDGTSMASPHVAGCVALGLSRLNGGLGCVEELLEESAQPLESDGRYDNSWVFGAGLARADKLLARIVETASRRRDRG